MNKTIESLPPAKGQFLVYPSEDGRVKIDVRLENETVWLTQQHMVALFQTTKQNVSLHLQNIFHERELVENSVVKEHLTTASDGKSYQTKYYNLDAIISVGYRVKSAVATRFRIWATQKLREYIVKGFVLDDERLKNPDQPFDYFEELLRRIQDIRTSERRFYQKITDIYATSIDYDPTQPESIAFFQTVQNKLHWAITGQTAAEIIHTRANAAKPNMGLTNWRGARVRKEDVSIAKSYLDEQELAALNNLVEQYLLFAEAQAMRRVPMHMRDWIAKLNAFLTVNERAILEHAGAISHEICQRTRRGGIREIQRTPYREGRCRGRRLRCRHQAHPRPDQAKQKNQEVNQPAPTASPVARLSSGRPRTGTSVGGVFCVDTTSLRQKVCVKQVAPALRCNVFAVRPARCGI